MSLRRQKKIEIIINFLDDKLLKTKISHDSEFIDIFIIINLSYYRQKKKKNFLSEFSNLTDSQVHLHDIRFGLKETWISEFRRIMSFCREEILNLDYDLDDIVFVSKSHEFFDYNLIDKSLYNENFTILNHQKIFWDKSLTDNKFIFGSIITRVSSIIYKSLFEEIYSIYYENVDKFDHTRIKNGFTFIGLNDFTSFIKQLKYQYISSGLNDVSEELLSFYRENLLSPENINLLETKTLSYVKIPKKISKKIRKKSFSIKEKTIKINLTDQDLFEKNNDTYFLNLKETTDLRKNLYFDGTTFFVYNITKSLDINEIKKLLFLNVKKAASLFFPKSNDKIHIISQENTKICEWKEIDEVLFS
jgi:hypothetical protein